VSRRRIAAIDAEAGRIVICKVLYEVVIVVGNISEMIGMLRHILMIDSRTVLRTMLIAGVLVAMVLACAGTAADVDMQIAEAAA
jgi:hypothetical protein